MRFSGGFAFHVPPWDGSCWSPSSNCWPFCPTSADHRLLFCWLFSYCLCLWPNRWLSASLCCFSKCAGNNFMGFGISTTKPGFASSSWIISNQSFPFSHLWSFPFYSPFIWVLDAHFAVSLHFLIIFAWNWATTMSNNVTFCVFPPFSF